MATKSEIIVKATRALRQVAGTSVQTYTEPLLDDFFEDAFDFVNQKHWWPDYTRWMQSALDGSTGVISDDLVSGSELLRFKDIRVVLPPDTNIDKLIPLRPLPQFVNPYNLTGTDPLYVEGLTVGATNYATRRFRVWPLASTGTLTIHHRFRPKAVFDDDDEIYLDEIVLKYGIVWMYLKDDGTMPEMTDEYKSLFDIRFRDLVGEFDSEVLDNPDAITKGNLRGYPTKWFEDPTP